MSTLSPLIELHIMEQAAAYIDSLPEADRSSLNNRLHKWYRLLNSPFSSPSASRSSSPTCPPNSPNPYTTPIGVVVAESDNDKH